MAQITEKDKELIGEAKMVAKTFSEAKWEGEHITGVGAALRTKNGKIYSGPNIFHPQSGPSSICAEYTALAKAYSEGHREIDTIVAYQYHKGEVERIITPCGKCREFMRLFGNPWIIVKNSEKIRLKELLPLSDRKIS